MEEFTGKRGVNEDASEKIQKSMFILNVFTLLTLHYVT
jgi:hypothetical protein